jgi:hypothetical protein
MEEYLGLSKATRIQQAHARVMNCFFWIKCTGMLESYQADSDVLITGNA